MSFDVWLILESLPQLLSGLALTVELLALSALLGLLLAVVLLLMRLSGRWFLAWPAFAYCFTFRGTPLLVQLFVIYYGLPQFEAVRESLLWPLLRDPYWAGHERFARRTSATSSVITLIFSPPPPSMNMVTYYCNHHYVS